MADRSVAVRLRAEIGQYKRAMADAGKSTSDLGKQISGVSAKSEKDFDKLANAALGFGAGVTAAVGFAAKSAMDWETAWTGVLKTVDGTGPQLARLEDGLRNLAKETGFAHTEVAAVAEAAGQLGISTAGVEGFSRTMLDMGVSTNLGAEEAATGLARFRNIMGSSESEIGNMGSTIVGLGNSFATTESEILEMSMRLAGAGRQAGLTESDVMGLAASMSSVGIEAEAGGTAMSLTMKRIEKEVADGGAKLKMFADVAGVSTKEFADWWKSDAAGALTDFVKGLSTVDQRGQSANEVLRELGITGIREADALLRLSGNAEGVASAIDMASQAWSENTALTEEAGKFYGTTAQQVKQAWADVRDAGIDAGASLLPVIADGAEGVAKLAQGYASLPDPVKSSSTAFIAMSGALALGTGAALKANRMLTDLSEALGSVSRRQVLMRGGAAVASAGLASFSSTAHETSDALGVVTDTAAGAAMGFAVGGPWGAAIGGAGGLLYGLVQALYDTEEGMLTSLGANEQYAASLDQISGAATEATKALVYEDLRKSGVISSASAFGVAARDVVDAALGQEEALARVRAQLQQYAGDADSALNRRDILASIGVINDDLSEQQRKFEEARAATMSWEEALAGLPEEVHVELKNRGYRVTFEEVQKLIGAYRLTPDQVTTLMEALDFATPDINAVLANLHRLDGQSAVVTMTTVQRTIQETIVLPPSPTPRANSLADMFAIPRVDGGLLAFYANGGLRENHVAQIAPAGAWRVWAEPETGGEAYIPLAKSKRPRSAQIWRETGVRLGLLPSAVESFADGSVGTFAGRSVTWYANGGITGGADAVSPAELTRLRIKVRDLEADLRKGGPDRLHGLDRTLAQQELNEARAELRAAQAANWSIWGKRHTAETWNAARSTAEDFADNADVEFTTPAGVERQLQRKLAEMGEFTIALAELKRKGASPWLLEQLMQAGPSRSSIRTARQLAQDTARLRRLNAMASQIDQVSGLYGQMTQDPRFLQSSAAWGSLTAAHQSVIEKSVNVTVNAADPSWLAREVSRLVKFETDMMAKASGT